MEDLHKKGTELSYIFYEYKLTSNKKDARMNLLSSLDGRELGNYYCKMSSLKGGFSDLFGGKSVSS